MMTRTLRAPRYLPRLEQPPAGWRTAPSIRRLDPTVFAVNKLAASPAAGAVADRSSGKPAGGGEKATGKGDGKRPMGSAVKECVMKYRGFGERWIVRIDKGEEIVEELKRFCREKGIAHGHRRHGSRPDRKLQGLDQGIPRHGSQGRSRNHQPHGKHRRPGRGSLSAPSRHLVGRRLPRLRRTLECRGG